MKAYQIVNLNASVCNILNCFFEGITHSAYGIDHLFIKRAVDLISQPAYARFNNICLRIKIIIPDMLHNHRL